MEVDKVADMMMDMEVDKVSANFFFPFPFSDSKLTQPLQQYPVHRTMDIVDMDSLDMMDMVDMDTVDMDMIFFIGQVLDLPTTGNHTQNITCTFRLDKNCH